MTQWSIRLTVATLGGSTLNTGRHSDLLRRIHEAAEDGFVLARRLLDLGHAVEEAPVAIDFNELVVGVGEILDDLAGSKIEVNMDIAAEHAQVRIDRLRARQALLNLGRNAIDAVDGRGAIQLSTCVVRAAGDHHETLGTEWFQLEVSDTGPGIAPAVMDRLFRPFVTTRPDDGRRGLGLSTARDVVIGAGGTIEAQNSIDAGARFTVRLPLDRPT